MLTVFLIGILGIAIVVYIYRRIKRIGRYPENVFLQKPELSLPKHPLPDEEVEKIIKKSHYEHPELLDEEYDVIVIGSGISGMVSAGLLSKAKKKVLLLESHDRLGGLTHCFEEKSFNFCVGVHFVVDLTPDIHLVTENVLTQRPHSTGEMFELGDRKLLIKNEKYKDLKKYLFEMFPLERNALKSFLDIMEKVGNSTKYGIYGSFMPFHVRCLWWLQGKTPNLYHKYGRVSTEEILNECGVRDEVLRWFLKDNILAYFDPNLVKRKNFSIHARYNIHLLKKKNIIIGPYGCGGDNFAKIIIPNMVSRGNGSQALCNAEVTRILFDKRRSDQAIGVEIKGGKKIYAKNIISSVGVENTMKLMPKIFQNRTKYKPYLEENPYTGFFFVIFIGLDCPPEEVGLKYGIHVLQKSSQPNLIEEFMNLEAPNFEGFHDLYSVWLFSLDTFEKEYKHYDEKCQLQVLVPMNPKWFEKFEDTRYQNRVTGYQEVKENFTSLCLEVVYDKFPKMEDHVEYLDGGTNLSYEHYCKSPKGAGYGMCLCYNKVNTFTESMKDIVHPIPNLFVVGQDTYSPGIGGQMIGCFYACGKILRRNLFVDMMGGLKKMKKRQDEERRKNDDLKKKQDYDEIDDDDDESKKKKE